MPPIPPFRARRRALLALGAATMLNNQAVAAIRKLTRLPRPTIFGTWRVDRIDGRVDGVDLIRPIKSLHFAHFNYKYLPPGTTLSFKDDGAWGTNHPEWHSVDVTFHAPFPKEVAGIAGKDNKRHFLADLDGQPWQHDTAHTGHLAIGILGGSGDMGKNDADFLRKRGFRDGALYFFYQGEGGGDDGTNFFVPSGLDELYAMSWYKEIPDKDYAEGDCSGRVAMILKRVK